MLTNHDILTHFQAYLLSEQRAASNTAVAYKRDLEQFEQFLSSISGSLSTITVYHVREYLKHLHNRRLSSHSIARKVSAIKSLCVFMQRRWAIDNVAADIHLPKVEKRLPRYLTPEQVVQLLQAADKDETLPGKRNKMMLYVLYATGMRVTELVTLTTNAIDHTRQCISITGKGGRQRIVPLPSNVFILLKQYLSSERPSLIGSHAVDYLFPVVRGKKIALMIRQRFWMMLNELWYSTGNTSAISPHQLRHSFATHMLAKGADLRSLQLLLGHENVTTVQVYTHVELSQLREVYDKKHPRS